MAVRDLIPDYSKTRRIVFLIDLNPLLYLQDPTPYLTSLLSSTKTLLSFPPLSSSLFSFKPSFSSLSLSLSSSKLPLSSHSLSFNNPETTLLSLTSFLSTIAEKLTPNGSSLPSPKASYVAASLRQLVHDYAWELVIRGDSDHGCEFAKVRSNLVVLFSPVCRDKKLVCDFLDLDVSDECLSNGETFIEGFRLFFESVNDAFVSRDIHVSWVDVKYGLEFSEHQIGLLESGIRDLGWGFCSSASVVLGSAVVPFGLIYPMIGVSIKFSSSLDCGKRNRTQLGLQISDVKGNPLECKCCDLELADLKMLSRNRSLDVSLPQEYVNDGFKQKFAEIVSGKTAKLRIKTVKRYAEPVNFEGNFCNSVLVRELSVESDIDKQENAVESLANRVLDILAADGGEFVQRKSIPLWHIFLSFLYREGYWAVVSISDNNGGFCMGLLKPFTISSAFLLIANDGLDPNSLFNGFGGGKLALPSFSGKKNKKSIHALPDLSWNAFCMAAHEQFRVCLEDVYVSQGYKNSKKLKFLKCWIKQVSKSEPHGLSMPNEPIPKEEDDRFTKLTEESEEPFPSSVSVGEDASAGASQIQDEVAISFRSETADIFFGGLQDKTRYGLESGWVDLGNLAKRLLSSSIYWLCQKHEAGTSLECPTRKCDATTDKSVLDELTTLLLKEHKDLAAEHKNDAASSRAEYITREYELQILFRMEILHSEIGATIRESTKQKFVKQICMLLETIQCHMEGGFFGDWSLDKYVDKIIRSRYYDTLGDVVDKIYKRMDLLLFVEEKAELCAPLLNSEDSNQSWKQKLDKDEDSETHQSVSVEDENVNVRLKEISIGRNARKLVEARKRAHKMLQIVWAPKQPSILKLKYDSVRNMVTKKKERGRGSCDRVCETPMTANKRSRHRSDDDKHLHNSGVSSVSKALFQDDP